MKLLLIILGLVGIPYFVSAQTDTNNKLPIIDMHMHAFSGRVYGRSKRPQSGDGKTIRRGE